MELELVLNELSLQSLAEDIPTARQRMAQFIPTIRAVTRFQTSKALRTSSDLNDILLAPEYPVRRWRNDPGVELEQRRFFRSLASKMPILVDRPDITEATWGIDCLCNGQQAIGFRAALLLEALPLSVLSEPCWDTSQVEVETIQMDHEGTLVNEQITLVHASRIIHVEAHREWIQHRLRIIEAQRKSGVRSGGDLWNMRTELFPSLIFCADVHAQVQILLAGDARLPHILRLLQGLETYCQAWKAAAEWFDAQRLVGDPSQESEATLNQFAAERQFLCPDGITRLFDWHLKLQGMNWRIHFFPHEATKTIIIGYIGRHLRTARYRT